MKLAAIYNVWDGSELLKGSIKCLKKDVDVIIIVYQNASNIGEEFYPLENNDDINPFEVLVALNKYVPDLNKSAGWNEKEKRSQGLDVAEQLSCTHFFMVDCDEYYEDFKSAKKEYIDSGAEGSVCQMYTYFKHPTLRLHNVDNYYVPFIHKLKQETVCGVIGYPYYVDPTRSINTSNVVLLKEKMHHFSWIRKDIDRKIRNSTAVNNIKRSKLREDYFNPECKEGFYLKDYDQTLIKVDDKFGIEEYLK